MTISIQSFPGHAGRPGQVGGSAPGKGGGSVSIEDAVAKVNELDKVRQWGKLPTSEFFHSTIEREDAGKMDAISRKVGDKKETKVVSFSDLIATQRGVDTDVVKDFIRSGDFSKSHGGSDAPIVIRLNQKNYVVDGHNRIVAAMLLGKKEIPMRFVDGDKMQNNMEIYAALNEHYTVREAMHQGKTHLVVPVIMMREGVHNGSHGQIFHPIDELGHFEGAWNGIPVSIQHPSVDGKHVSANSPDIIDANVVGKVFNTHVEGDKLRAEAWLDKERLKQISPATAAYLQKGQPVEVSLGMFTDDEAGEGNWNGESYVATARNHRPDHLALLPGGKGACSWKDGCGIRANEENNMVRTKFNTNKEGEQNMADDKKPCCPDKVALLIQNENSKFTADDADFLNTLTEAQLAKLEPIEVNVEEILIQAMSPEEAACMKDPAMVKANPNPMMRAQACKAKNKKAPTANEDKGENKVEVTKDQVVQVLAESFSDPDKFLALLPAPLRDQMESGLKLHGEHREKMIDHVMTNQAVQVWSKEDLGTMPTNQLQKVADSIPGKVDYRLNGNRHVQANADNDEIMLPLGVNADGK